MCGTAVETFPVAASEDRTLVMPADDQVDGASSAWDERDGGRLVALAGDPQGPVATLDCEVFDVGLARFTDPEAVQAEQHGERLVDEVVVVGGGKEHAELRPVQTASVGWMDLRAADILGWVRGDAAVDVSEPVEAAHRRKPSVDRRRSESSLLHRASPQLDVRAGRGEHGNLVVSGPLKEST